MKYRTALGVALIMLAFAFGIPLLGWGVGDLAGFLSNSARALYALCVLSWALSVSIGLLLLPFPYTPGKREGDQTKMVSRQSSVPSLARLIWLAIFLVSPYCDRRGIATLGEGTAFRYAGLPMFVLGLGWVAWSFLALGKQHSGDVTIQAGHQLVASGPYRWVRHPMYLGLIVFPWGVGLVFRSWIGALLPLLLIALFIWRIGDEERLMQQEFGEQWVAYRRRTRRLIPFIY